MVHSGSAEHDGLLRALERSMAVAELSPGGTLLRANDNYAAIFGYRASEMAGMAYRDLYSPQPAHPRAYEEWLTSLAAGKILSGICERRRRDGSPCWLEATYVPIADADGAITHIETVATDVSARMLGEQAQPMHLTRLSMVADASDTAVVITDENGSIRYINAGFTRMLGWRLEEISGLSPMALLSPHLSQEFTAQYRAELRRGSSVHREEIVLGKNGDKYWIRVQANPIMGPDGRLQSSIAMLTDITQAKMHEVLQRRVLESMARDQPLVDVLELMCRKVERIAPDITASILEIENGRLHSLAAPSLPDAYTAALDGLAIGPLAGSCGTAAFRNQPVLVRDIATDPLWAEHRHLVLPLGYQACWSTPIRTHEGQVIGTFALYYRRFDRLEPDPFHQKLINACTDLCALALEREQARRRIRQLAFYDPLTQLPNRSLLLAQADKALKTAAHEKSPLAIIFINLDRFKQINDSLGRPAGDKLLCTVARRMLAQVRPQDIVGRLSGDEFVVALPNCSSPEAVGFVERLQTLLAQPLEIDRLTLTCSASCGISMFPADGRDMETLLHRADMATHQAKTAGRGHYSFFSPEMNRHAQERLALETALRQALQANGLHLHYQPQIELDSGSLCGVEALARWTDAQLGNVSPARFIPLAEECGLIDCLGQWALQQACRQLSEWRRQGLQVPSISVNLSPTSFHNPDLPRIIAAALSSNGLRPRDLILEITESLLLDPHPGTRQTLETVHAQGIRLSMDDFGTGYSSLSYLRHLPVSELKLDRSFVADLENDQAAQALSNAILGIGRSLHLTVVAEGVETPGQLEILGEQGYPVAQGYLFSRPLAATDFERWLRSSS